MVGWAKQMLLVFIALVAVGLRIVEATDCQDQNHQCPYWAAIGECKANPTYMLANCRASCHVCPGDNGEALAEMYHGLEAHHLARHPPSNHREAELVELSFSPRVYSIDGFLSEEECEVLKKLALPELHAARTIERESGAYKVNKVRTNSQMNFNRTVTLDDPVVSGIVQRMHNLARMPIGHAEPLQVGRYKAGEFYEPHFDSETTQNVLRTATLLVYLDSPEEGGETIFPKRRQCQAEHFEDCCSKLDELVVGEGGGFWVAGKKGQAVLFYSHDLDGRHNAFSMHGSCPVRAGEKWIAQQWFRSAPWFGSPHHEATVEQQV